MVEYDLNEMKEMTVKKFNELYHLSDNEDDNDRAMDALTDINLYLYSNCEEALNLDIFDSEIIDNKFSMALRFDIEDKDCPIIQCDADDFITSSIHGEFEDNIEIDVTDDMTFMDIALRMKDEIEKQVEREYENAVEEACEDYREHHSSHRSYWWTR